MPEHGGKRTPGRPAPVSGPGQLSRRTDGGPQQVQAQMSGMPYGENMEFEAIQSSAPLNASSQTTARATRTGGGRSGQSQAGMGIAPLMSPTQRPDEPITAGAPFGPGPGPSDMSNMMSEDIEMIKQYLPDLEAAANFRGAPKTFVALVNYLRSL
jgi:hypothetical protein